jgi:16S rRNA (guanine527-N7)-methyltransferase
LSRLIEALLEGASCFDLELDSDQVRRFSLFAEELRKWNRKINLTSIEGDAEVAIKHFVDSIAPLKYLNAKGLLLDIGSGGGFPSIPLRICSALDTIVSIDAVEKKINFQKNVARKLDLAGFEAVHVRAENYGKDLARNFDFIVSRAFSDIPKFALLALPLLAENGKIVAMKGRNGVEEAESVSNAIMDLGLKIDKIEEYKLPITGDCRSLIIIKRNI